MITVEQISRFYDDFVAVNDVSFEIGRGEIVGLLGHNGAGKTTIMKMLTGYLEPSQGRIQIGEFDIETHAEQAQALIGYLPESLPVYPEMRVFDYLEYCAQVRGLVGPAADQAVLEAIRRTELADKALEPISTLSRGYKQRVGVAQAILHKPKLLILDEPTNGLDPHQTLQMRELLRELAQDATVILSTHIMQEVDALCDRVLIMRNGTLVVNEQLHELRRSQALQVNTNLDPAAFAALAKQLELVIGEQETLREGHHSYRLAVEGVSDIDALAARIAAAVHQAQGQLYSLACQQRDLESLFREINTAEVAHAA